MLNKDYNGELHFQIWNAEIDIPSSFAVSNLISIHIETGTNPEFLRTQFHNQTVSSDGQSRLSALTGS